MREREACIARRRLLVSGSMGPCYGAGRIRGGGDGWEGETSCGRRRDGRLAAPLSHGPGPVPRLNPRPQTPPRGGRGGLRWAVIVLSCRRSANLWRAWNPPENQPALLRGLRRHRPSGRGGAPLKLIGPAGVGCEVVATAGPPARAGRDPHLGRLGIGHGEPHTRPGWRDGPPSDTAAVIAANRVQWCTALQAQLSVLWASARATPEFRQWQRPNPDFAPR